MHSTRDTASASSKERQHRPDTVAGAIFRLVFLKHALSTSLQARQSRELDIAAAAPAAVEEEVFDEVEEEPRLELEEARDELREEPPPVLMRDEALDPINLFEEDQPGPSGVTLWLHAAVRASYLECNDCLYAMISKQHLCTFSYDYKSFDHSGTLASLFELRRPVLPSSFLLLGYVVEAKSHFPNTFFRNKLTG